MLLHFSLKRSLQGALQHERLEQCRRGFLPQTIESTIPRPPEDFGGNFSPVFVSLLKNAFVNEKDAHAQTRKAQTPWRIWLGTKIPAA